jgi:ElaB/YqjD/DUF883 family membrane-anchored ribosome-binding protein
MPRIMNSVNAKEQSTVHALSEDGVFYLRPKELEVAIRADPPADAHLDGQGAKRNQQVEFTIEEEITMQTEILERTIEVRDQLGAEVKRVKEAVTDAVEDGLCAARRAVKHGRHAAEDLVDDAEYRIKQRPFSALGVSFGIGMGLGAAIGVLLARNGRCGR